MTGGRAERGLALVSVLWGVSILSIIAAAMLSASLTGAYVGRNIWNATRGGTLDEAAINRTILSLMDDRPQSQPRVDGSSSTLRFDGKLVRVWIQDESGRININFASKETLKSLFQSAGVERDSAAALAGVIVARRGQDLATPATVIPFHTTDELLAVPGMSGALYARILSSITVYGRISEVNRSVASRDVLLTLPDMDANGIADFLHQRDAQRVANPPSGSLATSNATFMITAEAHVGGARTVRVAVVQFTGDETKPYWFLSWQ